MPQETLTFPPLYCVVGAYRLAHDPSLWQPMWAKCSKAAKHASIVALIWAVLTWPIQRLFVYYFMSASASVTGFSAVYGKMVRTADVTDDALPFRIPVPSLQTFATFMFVMGQVHAIMEFWLRRKLRECRNTAYVQTVRSRGKAADWWTEYVEEFSNPPTEKAIKDAKKQGWHLKLASPLVRFVILKVFLLPVDFVPFFGMALGAALRSLTYGRLLHKSFFEAKRMSPFQIELWITERQTAYRSFGFVAALMERIPLIGLIFSISNRIGAAMWAHDLEKRQQRFRTFSSSSAGGEQLEEFKSKPTLKKLYNTIQQESSSSTTTSTTTSGTSGAGAGDAAGTTTFNGEGLAVLRRNGKHGNGLFTHFAFTFPLKLISPGVSSRNATRDPLVCRRPQPTAASSQAAVNAPHISSSSSSSNASGDGADSTISGRGRGREGEEGGKAVSVLYVVGYGGGLVSGDSVDLDVDVGSGCCLLILTQGSTKVFKTRMSRPTVGVSTASFSSSSAPGEGEEGGKVESTTRQNFRFLVRSNSTLVLLPDPVTCFASARYDQTQRFDLRSRTSSCIVLDWITPGRTAVPPSTTTPKLDHLDSHTPTLNNHHRSPAPTKDYSTPTRDPELWSFSHYRSRNDLRIASTPLAHDTLLLSQPHHHDTHPSADTHTFTELARRNHPYGCYATLLLAGPDAQPIIHTLEAEFAEIQQRPRTSVGLDDEVLWCLSRIEEGEGVGLVRLAGRDAGMVKGWLGQRLVGLQGVIGSDLYRQALG